MQPGRQTRGWLEWVVNVHLIVVIGHHRSTIPTDEGVTIMTKQVVSSVISQFLSRFLGVICDKCFAMAVCSYALPLGTSRQNLVFVS